MAVWAVLWMLASPALVTVVVVLTLRAMGVAI